MIYVITVAIGIAVAVLWARLNRTEQRLQAVIDQGQAKFDSLAAELIAARGTAPPRQDESEAAAPSDPPVSTVELQPTKDSTREKPQREEQPSVAAAYSQPAEPAITQEAIEPPADTPEPPQDAIPEKTPWHANLDFEDIFGRRLPIWAGGIALTIAGIFLVRYAIEAGVFTPAVRVIASFLFGFALITGAEAAYRFEEKIADPRVRQALAGAGIATLFGAFYLAGSGYGLIGPTLAFVGLAAVTAGAIALSFRFGLPCAVLGLVGGFAAPVMIESDSANVPLLSLYLALVTGGLAWTGLKQGQRWLGYVALAVGLGWGFLMQVAGLGSSTDLLAIGGYLIVLGTVLPAFLYDREGPGAIQIIAGAAATLQMALMVGNAGFEPLTWALYLLIAAALAALGWRFPRLRPGSAIAAVVGIWLIGLWPDASPGEVLAVSASMVAVFLAVPLAHQWRRRANLIDMGQLAIGAVGLGVAVSYQLAILPDDRAVSDAALALILAGIGAFPAGGFLQRWRMEEGLDLKPALLLGGATHLLAFASLLLVTPAWLAPVMAAILAFAAVALLWQREAVSLRVLAWSAIAIVALSLLATPDFENEAQRLFGVSTLDAPLRGLARWASLLAALVAMSFIREKQASRLVADGLAALAAYGALAQVIPDEALPAVAAIGGTLAFLWREGRFTAWCMAIALAFLWSLAPILSWLGAGLLALAGDPFMADRAITPLDIATRLAPAAALAMLIAMRSTVLETRVRLAFAIVPGVFAILAAHSLFKQGFAITSLLAFEQYGMGERSIWQALLVVAGIGIAQANIALLTARLRTALSAGLIAVGLAHFVWFTLLLHNPLVTPQAVGPTPVANWLTLGYGAAIAALIALRDQLAALWDKARAAVDAAVMALISLLCVSLLRQAFAGSILTATAIGSTESLLLSLLGIALALAFLAWGSRSQQRSWRVGSLVLMLMAVLKVFLVDAAGLEGLVRIASFMALGFSLIGIGWVYTRQLKRPVAQE